MLTGFEDITYELTPEEKKLAVEFVRGLSLRVGKKAAISNREINEVYAAKYNQKIGEARVRKIISYIRTTGMLPRLVATSKGYFVAQNPTELKTYLDSLNQRINEITRTRDSIAKDLHDWGTGAQPELFR